MTIKDLTPQEHKERKQRVHALACRVYNASKREELKEYYKLYYIKHNNPNKLINDIYKNELLAFAYVDNLFKIKKSSLKKFSYKKLI